MPGRGPQHDEAAHQAASAERAGRRHRAARRPSTCPTSSLIDPKDKPPDPGADRGDRRAARARRRALRGEAGLMADDDHPDRRARAAQDDLRAGDPAAAPGGVRLRVADAAPAAREDHAEHGRRRGQDQQQGPRRGRGAAGDHRRPAPVHHPRPQVDRPVQAARGHGHRLQGDPARQPHVGVPRPAHVGRAPADPRLPRASTRTASTAAATTTSACASRRSSRRSTTTASTRCAA